MWLAICEPWDDAGLWAVAGLRASGMPVEIVAPSELLRGASLSHRLGDATTDVELRTAAGLEIHSGEVRGVFNRMRGIPDAALAGFAPGDRGYVADELTATTAGWLASLSCPVLNRPAPGGLGGPRRPLGQWRWLAAQVGLPTCPWRLGSSAADVANGSAKRVTVFAIGGRVVGPVPTGMGEVVLALARVAGAGLLGVGLVGDRSGGLRFDEASSLPDLRAGGEPALGALRDALEAG